MPASLQIWVLLLFAIFQDQAAALGNNPQGGGQIRFCRPVSAAEQIRNIYHSRFGPGVCADDNVEAVESLRLRPSVHYLSSIPLEHHGVYSIDFLTALAASIHDYLDEQIKELKRSRDCLRSSKPVCVSTKNTLLKAVPACAKQARESLYLSFEKQMSNRGWDVLGPNSEMFSFSFPKAKPWFVPTGDELRGLRSRFQREVFQPADEFARQERAKDGRLNVSMLRKQQLAFYRGRGDEELSEPMRNHCGAVESTRSGHAGFLRQYHDIMQTWPILSFIQSGNPDEQEVYQALSEMIQNANAQKQRLAEMLAAYDNNPTNSVPSGFLDLMSPEFLPLMNFMLGKHPEYCGIAASLFDLQEKRQDRNLAGGVGAGFALMFFPPSWAFAGGVALTGAYLASEYSTFTGLQQLSALQVQATPRAEGRVEVSREDLLNSSAALQHEVFMSPLALFGMSAGLKKLRQVATIRSRVKLKSPSDQTGI